MNQPLKPVARSPEPHQAVVAAAAYLGGRRIAEIPVDEAGEWSRRPGHVVWIGLHEPSLDLLREAQAEPQEVTRLLLAFLKRAGSMIGPTD